MAFENKIGTLNAGRPDLKEMNIAMRRRKAGALRKGLHGVGEDAPDDEEETSWTDTLSEWTGAAADTAKAAVGIKGSVDALQGKAPVGGYRVPTSSDNTMYYVAGGVALVAAGAFWWFKLRKG